LHIGHYWQQGYQVKNLYDIYKWLIYIPGMGLLTFVNAMGVVVVSPFSVRKASRWFGGMWGRGLLHLIPARLQVLGEEHLLVSPSYVVVANHLSLIDIPILYGWLALDLKWVMKQELRTVPLIGSACARLGHIFIDRRNRAVALRQLEEVKLNLQPGTSILFFPEGSRSRDGQLKKFKLGAFTMAKDLDVPILPITIRKADTILPPDGMALRPGSAQMIIHAPIDIAEVRSSSAEVLRDRARQIIASAIEE
jgi:1-acyl-sn-glycerol-3-phosphate acyltransferase